MIRLAAVFVAPVVAVGATVALGAGVLGEQERLSSAALPSEVEPQVESYAASGVADALAKRPTSASRTSRRALAAGDPMLVRINSLSPATLPESGPVTIRGSVVNRSEDTWTDPKVYPLNSTAPMTTVAELRAAAALDPTTFVGERITTPGVFVDLPDLAPGEKASFRLRVPRSELLANGLSGLPGIYWVGAQVLAADEDGVRDGLAKGRDRMFVPLVGEVEEPVSTSIVVPLRRTALSDEAGLADPEAWATDLGPDGRLTNLVEFVDAADGLPVTWLVDPAVLDAAARLAEGNPARSITATLPAEEEEEESSGGGASGEVGSPLALAAEGWLEQVVESLSEHRVLALPYGDLDVAAAGSHRPGFYETARDLSLETLDELDITARSAVVPPSGLLNSAGLNAAAGSEVLVSDEALGLAELPPDAGPPSMVLIGGELVSVYDSALTASAGPSRTIQLRQRILAEAALRAIAGSDEGLLVSLPFDFDPGSSASRFFAGLEQPYLDLASGSPTPSADVGEVTQLVYTQRQVERELDADAFDAAAALIESGESLDRVLPDNDEIGGRLLQEAMTTTSYLVRELPITANAAAADALTWSREQLSRVTIVAPDFVILSARTGPFAVTLRNRLPERVSIQIRASSNRRLTVEAPEEIILEPESQVSVNLSATARSIGVTSVRLLVTDEDGQPLGDQAEVSVRSNQVGRIIWVVMGVGVGILFLAIGVRLVRRVRGARAS